MPYLCSFSKTAIPITTTSRCGAVNQSQVVKQLILHKAHITIPQRRWNVEDWFIPDPNPNQPVTILRIQGVAIIDQGRNCGVRLECAVVWGDAAEEVGSIISDGIPYRGDHCIRSVIKDLSLQDVCQRGKEWILADEFGIDDTDRLIHPIIWEYLVSNNLHDRLLDKAPRCL